MLGGPGWNVNQVPLFGSPYGGLRYGGYFGSGYYQQLVNPRVNSGIYNNSAAALNPWLYGSYLWGGYWNRPADQIPASPSYSNPAAVQPAEQVAQLETPNKPPAIGQAQQSEWAEVESAFQSASISVVAVRQAVEDLRARLAAMGQAPRANLTTGAANAEAALKRAQQQMSAGALKEARAEIQRAGAMARQLLREFGR
jgi:hypothetical protein